jgi:hypothetical protein
MQPHSRWDLAGANRRGRILLRLVYISYDVVVFMSAPCFLVNEL